MKYIEFLKDGGLFIGSVNGLPLAEQRLIRWLHFTIGVEADAAVFRESTRAPVRDDRQPLSAPAAGAAGLSG